MKEQIITAAEQYGFNLEFKASKEFENAGYTCELNKILSNQNNIVEADVIACRGQLHIIVECKGSNKDTLLLLVKGSENRIKNDKIDPQYTRYVIHNDFRIPIFQISEEASIYTITGDFFKPKQCGKQFELQKASKNDDQNNFYKAQKQILEAISVYSKTMTPYNPYNDKNFFNFIIPLIVTNADIWVIDYNEDEPKISQHAGVLHRVVSDPNMLSPKLADDTVVKTFAIPVVNVQYIESILNSLENLSSHGQIQLDLRLDLSLI